MWGREKQGAGHLLAMSKPDSREARDSDGKTEKRVRWVTGLTCAACVVCRDSEQRMVTAYGTFCYWAPVTVNKLLREQPHPLACCLWSLPRDSGRVESL